MFDAQSLKHLYVLWIIHLLFIIVVIDQFIVYFHCYRCS
jgi:hypothetical protein